MVDSNLNPETTSGGGQGVTRREALKLSAAVAALSAGLGVLAGPADGSPEEELTHLELKLYSAVPGRPGNESTHLVTLKSTLTDCIRVLSLKQPELQVKLYLANYKGRTALKENEPLSQAQLKFETYRVNYKELSRELTDAAKVLGLE